MDFNERDTTHINAFEGLVSFTRTWAYNKFLSCTNKFIALFTGNQYGKTGGAAHSYALRVLGMHPVAQKNVLYFECENKHYHAPYKIPNFYKEGRTNKDRECPNCGELLKEHQRKSRVIRFCSANLPGNAGSAGKDNESAEVRNTQYPEFKKYLPPFLLKKDITSRDSTIHIHCPFGGKDIIIEFVSYNQLVQTTAGTQRMSIWCDEEPPKDFYSEQLPRLLVEDGDFILTLTPANYISWAYDEFFERARLFYRTKTYCDYINKDGGDIILQEQETDSKADIAVIQAATDDNPTLDPEVVQTLFDNIDDPDVIAIRRYGIFRQVSGRIFKDFDFRVHDIDSNKWLPEGIPDHWTTARMIDYHENNPWACSWIALSPDDEAFVFEEFSPSPEKYVTVEIAREVASRSGDYRFKLNLMDALAAKRQPNTGTSALDDFNRHFKDLKLEGVGTGGKWESWDTKSTRGRDEIRRRLKNSLQAKVPFNNIREVDGRTVKLPTIWFFNRCKETTRSIKQWRLEEWSDSKSLVEKDRKEKPQQKFSHFCTAIEAIFKDKRFKASNGQGNYFTGRPINRFQGRR